VKDEGREEGREVVFLFELLLIYTCVMSLIEKDKKSSFFSSLRSHMNRKRRDRKGICRYEGT